MDSLAALSPALAQTAQPALQRAWNRLAVLLQNIEIKEGGGQGGGQNVAWNVEFGTNGAAAYGFAEGADVPAGEFSQDPLTKAVLPWGQYRSTFALSLKEINAATANIANAAALEDMFAERLLGAVTIITDKINTDLWSGTGVILDYNGNPTDGIVGIDTALAATGIYAGVNKATFPEWAGNIRANSSILRPLTITIVDRLEQDIYTSSGSDPDFIGCDPAILTTYQSLFNPTLRTVSDGSKPVERFQGSTTGAPTYRGNPLTRDRRATANRLYLLNREGICLRVLPWARVVDGVPTMAMTGPSQSGDKSSSTGLQIHVYPLGRTGSAVKFVAEVYAQLQVTKPNMHGILQDLIET